MQARELIQESTSPIVLVIQDKQLDGFYGFKSMRDLLLGFEKRTKSHLIQDLSGNPQTLDNPSVRFVERLDQIDPVLVHSLLETDILPKYQNQLLSPKSADEALEMAQMYDFNQQTPWYQEYKLILSKHLNIHEHETFYHPVLFLYCISSKTQDPTEILKYEPSIYKHGYIDPNVLKLCLIINDTGDTNQLQQQIKNMPTFVLQLDPNAPRTVDIWTQAIQESYSIDSKFNQRDAVQHLMSSQDIQKIDQMISQFVLKHIFDKICSNMREWERDIVSARRGLSGRLFKVGLKYFSGKQQPAQSSFVDPVTKQVYYYYHSPEMMMRRLGDFAFMIRDYKYAQGIYDMLRKDFDKQGRYLGGVLEMLSVSLLMQGEVQKAEQYMEQAIGLYEPLKPLLAIRASMWYTDLLKDLKYYREAAQHLIKYSADDSDYKCALFLEQAAFCFLMCKIPKHRKYAQHLVLAGHRYSKAGQLDYYLRNYSASKTIYEDSQWTLIEDHLHFSLGKFQSQKGDLESGIDYFIRLLRKSRQAPHIQRQYLSEFLYLYQNYSKTANVDHLSELLHIPVIHHDSLQVLTGLKESETDEKFLEMEQELLKELKHKPMETKLSCAVGETTRVVFVAHNDLSVPIPINNVTLELLFDGQPLLIEYKTEMAVSDQVQIQTLLDVSLDAGEQKTITIQMHPKQKGTLKILGVRYLLCGIIPILKKFEKQIDLTITPPMPVLDLQLHGVPESMVAGQVVQAVLEINNKGSAGLRGLVVQHSHPTFVLFCSPDVSDQYMTQQPDNKIQFDNQIRPQRFTKLELPEGDKDLLPSTLTTVLPVWIRASRIGKHQIKFVFLYQSEETTTWRTLRYSVQVQVNPTLRMNSFARTSMTHLNEFIFGIELENLHLKPLSVTQLTCFSPLWTMSSIEEDPCVLGPGEIKYLYFRLSRISAPPNPSQTPEFETAFMIESFIKQDQKRHSVKPIDLLVSSLGQRIQGFSPSFYKMLVQSRTSTRMQQLSQQFSAFSEKQLQDMFNLFWSDDIEICVFWEMDSMFGHLFHSGTNCSLEPLPIASWLSRIDQKQLEGRSLFEATARERRHLIASLLKRHADASPVRVLCRTKTHNSVEFVLGNTSWMHTCEFDLEVLGQDGLMWLGNCRFQGTLGPMETQIFALEYVLDQPGTFDVNRWKLSLSLDFVQEILDHSGKTRPQKTFLTQIPTLPHHIQ